jgi:multidrug efflux system membrane fusion protein
MRVSYFIAAGIAVVAVAWVVSGQFSDEATSNAAVNAKDGVPADGAKPGQKAGKALVRVRVRRQTAEDRVNQVVVLGRTEASRKVDLKAETKGRIVAIGAREGEPVKKGDMIVRIAMDDRKAWLERAEARLEQRRMEYKAAKELSQRNFRSKTGLAAASAELSAARADVEAAKLDIARTEIHAPFDGVLETRTVEIGDVVKVDLQVATIVDLSPILVVGYVTENDVGRLKLGSEARARLVTGETVTGKISYIAAVADPASRTFRVEIEAPNEDRALVAGLTAELHLPQDTVRAHKVSPAVLTLNDEGQVGVKAVNADNTVVFYPVKIIADGDDGMWLGGLPETLTLITVGQEFVSVGETVIPVNEDALTAEREAGAAR